MNRLTREKRIAVVAGLVEGMSIRATARITGVAKNTVTKLLFDVGKVCSAYQDRVLRDLPCKKLRCDQIWSFVGAKRKSVPAEEVSFGRGDVGTWTAICADTKLVPSWLVGDCDDGTKRNFIDDLASRLANRIQIATDGPPVNVEVNEGAFGVAVDDYAMLEKRYGAEPPLREAPCSPAMSPRTKKTSTNDVERQNITMRMSMRRSDQLSNALRKKVETHAHAVALHVMHYNFVRIHQILHVTPAMAARVTDHVWDIAKIVDLLDAPPSTDADELK